MTVVTHAVTLRARAVCKRPTAIGRVARGGAAASPPRSRLEDMRRPTTTRGRFRRVFSSVAPGRVGASRDETRTNGTGIEVAPGRVGASRKWKIFLPFCHRRARARGGVTGR